MSDSLIQLQNLGTYRVPSWFTEQNRVWDDVLEDFSHGNVDWAQGVGYVARLFNTLWTPDFAAPTLAASVPGGAWVAPAVALTGVDTAPGGYCQADGIRFPAVSASVNPLNGMAIYVQSTGRLIWAATDFFGNLPILTQDVYVVFDSTFGAVFKL